MEITNEDIKNYLQSIDVTEENALEFYNSCITDNYSTPQGYVFRKILSQLEVRHHIENLDFALGQYEFGESTQILRSALRGEKKYADKMLQLDSKSKFTFKFIDQTTLRSIILSKNYLIEQFLFSIPSEIRVLKDEIANTPKNETNKIKQLNEMLLSAQKDLKRAEQEIYDISISGLPMGDKASEEWKNFFDSNISELKQAVGEYVEIGIKNKERKRVERGGTIGGLRYIDLSVVMNQILNGINEFLEAKILENEYLENLKIDIAMQLKLIKFVYQNNDLKTLDDVISGIRKQFNTTKLSSRTISTDSNALGYYRHNILNGEEQIWKNTADPEEIPEKMKELNKKYEELLKIEDPIEYKREAVKLYRNFIQIHPFADGNGRTSRYLLDFMMIQRGITPPILYDTYYDRRQLDYAMDEDIQEEGKKDTLLKFVEEGIEGKEEPKKNSVKENNNVKTELDALSSQEILDSRMRENIEKQLQRRINEHELEENYLLTNPQQRRSILNILKSNFLGVIKRAINRTDRKDGQDNSDGRD